jgi:hypothetical protein
MRVDPLITVRPANRSTDGGGAMVDAGGPFRRHSAGFMGYPRPVPSVV